MKINKILCPIDFSKFSEAANEVASTLAKSSGATIHYLLVTERDVAWGAAAYDNVEEEEEQALEALKKIRPTVDGIKATHSIEWELPAARIVSYADKHNIDLIVIGTHGRTGLMRILMGSVAESVMRKAKCPVLAVKAGNSPEENSEDLQSDELQPAKSGKG